MLHVPRVVIIVNVVTVVAVDRTVFVAIIVLFPLC